MVRMADRTPKMAKLEMVVSLEFREIPMHILIIITFWYLDVRMDHGCFGFRATAIVRIVFVDFQTIFVARRHISCSIY